MAFHVLFPAVAMLLYLIMMRSLMLTTADAPHYCHFHSGCCSEHNYGPGPLNLTTPTVGSDIMKENNVAFVYQCFTENFTSIVWSKKVNGHYIVFPWGENADRFAFTRDNNQTLIIKEANKTDAAYYKAVASNGTDQVEGEFSLLINCRETQFKFKIKPEPPVQHVKLHQRKTLRCAAYSRCNKSATKPTLCWKWIPEDSKKPSVIDNTTLTNVRVVCDTGDRYGNDCSLLIDSVDEEITNGQLVCHAMSYPDNCTVTLVLQETDVGLIVGIVLGVVTVPLVAGLMVFIMSKYRHKLLFKCRTLPDRGNFEHDVSIVSGDDHDLLVQEILGQELKKCGYDVNTDVAKRGRPETLEHANAIVTSFCVIFAFSNDEMQDFSTFLSNLLMQKSSQTVIFIRFYDADTSGDVWKRENLQMFKVLDWPTDVPVSSKVRRTAKQSKEFEKFLKKLQSKLPSSDKNCLASCLNQRRNGNVRQSEASSTSSTQPLLATTGRNDYVQINGSDTEQVVGEDESGFDSPQGYPWSLAHGLASAQACQSSLMDCISSPSATSNPIDFPDHDPLNSQNISSPSPLTAAVGQTNATHGCHENLIDFRGIGVPCSSLGSITDAAHGCEKTNSAGVKVKDLEIKSLGSTIDSGAERRFETQESGYHSLSPPVKSSSTQGGHIMQSLQQPKTTMLRKGENSQ